MLKAAAKLLAIACLLFLAVAFSIGVQPTDPPTVKALLIGVLSILGWLAFRVLRPRRPK